jgi:hypothetical protein
MKDFKGETVGVGDRIELHPAMDLWMRGAKYGSVVDVSGGVAKVQLDLFKVGKFTKLHPMNFHVIEKATGRFPALNENPGRYHAKIKRCVRKVKRRKGRKPKSAYAVCTASVMRGRKRNPTHYILQIQRTARSPVMTWTGHSFSNQPDHIAHKYPTEAAAAKEARRLISLNPKLLNYIVSVRTGVASQHNPSPRQEKLDAAAQKLEDFTGHPATHVERFRERSQDRTGLALGPLKAVVYEATRDGKKENWEHQFKARSRPLLVASTDGKQLRIVGGRYEFTDAGIEDR